MAGEEAIGRTITKRDVQMKIIKDMIDKGRDVMNRDDQEAELVKNKYRDLSVMLQNVNKRKEHVDKLNDAILDEVETDQIEKMSRSSDFDIFIDTEVALFEEYLEKCGSLKNEKDEVELDVQRSTIP